METPTTAVPAQATAWNRIKHILTANFYRPDVEAAKVLFACLAAHRLTQYPPAWLLMIAPPGSMKTVLLESLAGLPRLHFVNELTPNTLISGMLDKPGKPAGAAKGYLARIGESGILVNPEFSTMLSMDPHKRATIMSQLRAVYDGHFSREFGTNENLKDRDWKGRITFLAGVPPEVDSYHSVFQTLGERFLRVRWQRAEGQEAALCAMRQTEAVTKELRQAVYEFLSPLFSQPEFTAPELPHWFELYLAKLGEETVRARAVVPRASGTHEMLDQPQIESNTRLPQQLAQVARAWMVLQGWTEIGTEEAESLAQLVARVANDSIPPIRLAVLRAIREERDPYTLGIPRSVVKRAREELEVVGLLVKN